MILPLQEQADKSLSITSILRDRPNKLYVQEIQKYDAHCTMHMTGKGLDKAITKFDYYEDSRLLKLRQLYSPSNEDFYSRLHRPIDKIFTAKGGSTNYNIDGEKKQQLKNILSNVKDHYSIRKWIETYFMPAYWYDPMGIIMMEVGDAETYPTYKCVQTVYDMPKPHGRMFEYLVFKTDRKVGNGDGTAVGSAPTMQNFQDVNKSLDTGQSGYYRVIDDAYDYLILWNNGQATIIQDETYPNYFGYVPAVTASNIWDNVREFYVSPDNNTLGIADQHLRSRSVLVMFELHHGFPLNWMYVGKCPTCQGMGKRQGADCPSCNGSGKDSKKDVSKLMLLPYPVNKDMPVVTVPGGTVETAIDSWQEMKSTVDRQYREAHYCTWGTHQLEDSSQETATGRFIDVQPVNDRLCKYSDACEWIEKWITNRIGEFNFPNDYKGCEINYGRRFLIESPDEIWNKLQLAIANGKTNYSSLKNIYMQWVDSEYSGDEVTRLRLVMEFRLDPAPFMSIEQAQIAFVEPKQYAAKLFYSQWLESLPENWFMTYSYERLIIMRDAYADSKIGEIDPKRLAPPEPKQQTQLN